ncbi:MAG: double-strand break repair protein AddB [Pseudomonadota bacterium]
MFDPTDSARVFAIPLGQDFSASFADGLMSRVQHQPPEVLARTLILTNSARTGAAIKSALSVSGARLLPQIQTLDRVPDLPEFGLDLPPAVPSLRRRLTLSQAVGAFLTAEPDVAPQSARFSLAGLLAELMDEMQSEGVSPSQLANVDVAQHSEHWARNLKFLNIIAQHWDARRGVDPLDRLRLAAGMLADRWAQHPPEFPIIIAGSTGSRGATAILMAAVAALPNGAVVLPGWDNAQPADAWDKMAQKGVLQDHPQSMLLQRCQQLSMHPAQLPTWGGGETKTSPRNALISLALRPAPFTDDWLLEGPNILPSLAEATNDLALVTAPSPKLEADAIALRLRKAVQERQSAVLISPDRTLTRRVSTALRRWGIEPDDSAGRPLHQTPPAIFARLVTSAIGAPLRPDVLAAILKHPMTGSSDRHSPRKLISRRFEVDYLRGGPPEVSFAAVEDWLADQDQRRDYADLQLWFEWIKDCFAGLAALTEGTVAEFVNAHINAANALANPAQPDADNQLWSGSDGVDLALVFRDLEQESDAAGVLSATDYRNLFHTVLSGRQSRTTQVSHPSIAIWGTLEARVAQRDLVILGGLNDDVWPGAQAPDPWLNRSMRNQLGLTCADRQTGLSAHDFQQGFCAPNVMITRAERDGDAPTVASRWIVRLINLLEGLGDTGQAAVNGMKERGEEWLSYAKALDRPASSVAPAPRPAPCPPVEARFKELSVTAVEKLIRDPYSIYASHTLGLRKLDPLQSDPDARARGIALHEVVERFNEAYPDDLPADPEAAFLRVASEALDENVPWPGLRQVWLTRLGRVAGYLMEDEARRRAAGRVTAQEVWGERRVELPPVRLFGKADRIDRLHDGRLAIFDYKAGTPPKKEVVKYFQKQLDLEAAIASVGGFAKKNPDGTPNVVTGAPVARLEYVGLSGDGLQAVAKTEGRDLEPGETETIWQEFSALVHSYSDPDQTFPARPRMQKMQYAYDFDHLARKGEWWESDTPVRIDLT